MPRAMFYDQSYEQEGAITPEDELNAAELYASLNSDIDRSVLCAIFFIV